jgi:lipopolysaccharide/colanic/teichoic acid biosynthesis glycosyltransferase
MLTTSELRPQAPPLLLSGKTSKLDSRPPRVGAYLWVKTVVDRVAALLLLALTAPLILLAMVLVKLTSRGPALYSQTRLGRHGMPFTIFKIRTMAHECESLTGARWSVPGDARITPVGRWLRKSHIDELPQLWNVLCGAMSLVGPRPERPEFVPRLEQALPHYRDRLRVRPGVTGLAQVQLPPDTDLGSVRTKLAYDLHYVRNLGFWLDVRIVGATVLKMAAVPFRAIRWILSFPSRQTIVDEYAKLLAHTPQRQTPASKTSGSRSGSGPMPVMS